MPEETALKSPIDIRTETMYGSPDPTPEAPALQDPVEAVSADETPAKDPTPAGDEISPDAAPDTPLDAEDGDSTETPPADGDGPVVTDDGGVEVSSLGELAEYLETEPEWLETLTVSQKVNGEQVEVQLADALRTHRKVTAADTYLSDAKEKAKGIIQDATTHREKIGESMVVFATMIEDMEKSLDTERDATNWAQLRADDPAEYAARKEDQKDRRDRIDGLKQQAVANYTGALEAEKTRNQKALLDRLPQERELLVDRLPSWSDEKKAGAEREKVLNYLQKEGFTEQHIQAADLNGRVLALAVKAMRYDDGQGKLDKARKRIVKIPAKVLKPGSPADKKENPTPPSGDRAAIMYGS